MKGDHLDHALNAEDFIVFIGSALCNVTFLATNYLICKPPQTLPPGRMPLLDLPPMCSTVEVSANLGHCHS